MTGGLALAFSFQAGVLHMKVGFQALSTAKSTEKLQEMSCLFEVSVILSDSVFWLRAQDSSLSQRSLKENEAKKSSKRTKTPQLSIHAEFDQSLTVV